MTGAFGFLFPWFLCLLPFAIGFLIFVYRKSGKNSPLTVGTTYLLKLIKRPPETKKKFSPPLHFWLELIALISLIVSLSLPYIQSQKKRFFFLIDDSLSMRAKPEGQDSFFRMAQKEASQRMQELPHAALITLNSTSNTCFSDEDVSRQDAIDALSKCEATFTEDKLEATLSSFSDHQENRKLFIFTDKKLANEESANEFAYYNLRSEQPLRSMNNLTITSVLITDSEAKVEIASYSQLSEDSQITVSLGELLNENIQYYESKKIGFHVEPGEKAIIKFDNFDNRWEILRFQIETSAKTISHDAILEDNTYWITKNNSKKTLGIVSNTKNQTYGLESIPEYTSIAMTLEDYQSLGDEKPQALIFNQVTPASLPITPSLFILPDEKFIFGKNSAMQENSIIRWNNDSLLTQYVNFSLLSGSKGFALQMPSWAHGEIFGSGGITLASGEFFNTRYIASGIPLLPYHGLKAPALSILTLNILKELTQNFGLAVGDVTTLPDKTISAQYVDVPKNVLNPKINLNNKRYPVNTPGVISVVEESKKPQLFSVRFKASEESDLRGVHSVKYTLEANHEKKGAQQNISYARYLIWIAFIFLTLDLIIRLLKIFLKRGRFR